MATPRNRTWQGGRDHDIQYKIRIGCYQKCKWLLIFGLFYILIMLSFSAVCWPVMENWNIFSTKYHGSFFISFVLGHCKITQPFYQDGHQCVFYLHWFRITIFQLTNYWTVGNYSMELSPRSQGVLLIYANSVDESQNEQ